MLLGPGCEARRLTRTGTSASSDLSTIYNAQKFDIKASKIIDQCFEVIHLSLPPQVNFQHAHLQAVATVYQ